MSGSRKLPTKIYYKMKDNEEPNNIPADSENIPKTNLRTYQNHNIPFQDKIKDIKCVIQ
jgi:hypothetical protein